VDIVAIDRDRRRRYGRRAAVKSAMECPAAMPKLHKDRSTLRMHRVGDGLPPVFHVIGIDDRRFVPAVVMCLSEFKSLWLGWRKL